MATTTTGSSTATSIPLNTVSPAPSNSNASASNTIQASANTPQPTLSAPNAAATPSTVVAQPSTTTSLQSSLSNPFTSSTSSFRRRMGIKESMTFTNGVGMTALVFAVIFGIGAWVGMKVQISQGTQNMDLAIWTACADHETIQNTSLCRSIMAKDFSQFGKRFEPPVPEDEVSLTIGESQGLTKRDVDDDEPKAPEPGTSMSPLGKVLSDVSAVDREMINPDTSYRNWEQLDNLPEPAIRAMIFPFVNLLVKPLSWVFEFIEYMLLLVIYCIHKVFRWLTTVIIFMLQAWMYSMVESIFKSVLAVVDQAIYAVMPSFMPAIFVSDIASVLSLTGLRSYWYGTSYLGSLKWIIYFRVGIWLIVMTLQGAFKLPETIRSLREQSRASGGRVSFGSPKPWWRAGQNWLRRADSFPNFPQFSSAVSKSTVSIATSPRYVPTLETDRAPDPPRNTTPAPNRTLQAPALPPPPRRSPSPNSWGMESDTIPRPALPSSKKEDGESAEESFYKELNLKNRRPHAVS